MIYRDICMDRHAFIMESCFIVYLYKLFRKMPYNYTMVNLFVKPFLRLMPQNSVVVDLNLILRYMILQKVNNISLILSVHLIMSIIILSLVYDLLINRLDISLQHFLHVLKHSLLNFEHKN